MRNFYWVRKNSFRKPRDPKLCSHASARPHPLNLASLGANKGAGYGLGASVQDVRCLSQKKSVFKITSICAQWHRRALVGVVQTLAPPNQDRAEKQNLRGHFGEKNPKAPQYNKMHYSQYLKRFSLAGLNVGKNRKSLRLFSCLNREYGGARVLRMNHSRY
jgi:hypothetical protein